MSTISRFTFPEVPANYPASSDIFTGYVIMTESEYDETYTAFLTQRLNVRGGEDKSEWIGVQAESAAIIFPTKKTARWDRSVMKSTHHQIYRVRFALFYGKMYITSFNRSN